MKINMGKDELVKVKKGDRGLYVKLSDGQLAFPTKNSKLKEGYAKVHVVKALGSFSLIDGENIFD